VPGAVEATAGAAADATRAVVGLAGVTAAAGAAAGAAATGVIVGTPGAAATVAASVGAVVVAANLSTCADPWAKDPWANTAPFNLSACDCFSDLPKNLHRRGHGVPMATAVHCAVLRSALLNALVTRGRAPQGR